MRLTVLLVFVVGCQTVLPVAVDPGPPTPLSTYHGRLEAAKSISFSMEKDEALASIATDAAARGEASDAAALVAVVQQAVKGISFSMTKDEAAGRAVRALAARGMTAEATAVAKQIDFSMTRDEALKGVATGR